MSKEKMLEKEREEVWKLFGPGSKEAVAISYLTANRLRSLAACLADVDKISGDTAEVGVAAGGTSKLIALRNQSRLHWACDTFQGLMDVGDKDPTLSNGMFYKRSSGIPSTDSVGAFLTGLDNVRIVSGYFPESAPAEMRDAKFSFVHLDVDTYQSTLAGFRFFAERMSPGGILAIDDAASGKAFGVQEAWKLLTEQGWTALRQVEQQIVVKFA